MHHVCEVKLLKIQTFAFGIHQDLSPERSCGRPATLLSPPATLPSPLLETLFFSFLDTSFEGLMKTRTKNASAQKQIFISRIEGGKGG